MKTGVTPNPDAPDATLKTQVNLPSRATTPKKIEGSNHHTGYVENEFKTIEFDHNKFNEVT